MIGAEPVLRRLASRVRGVEVVLEAVGGDAAGAAMSVGGREWGVVCGVGRQLPAEG